MSDNEQVLLPAEQPKVFMTPEQYAAFSRAFTEQTRDAVRQVDPLPIANEDKAQIVTDMLVGVGVPMLQGSVKELRGVPPEVLSLAANALISMVVRLVRRTGG
jgi:hypothetical protein